MRDQQQPVPGRGGAARASATDAGRTEPDESPTLPLSQLAGYEVIGRHGSLGTVVEAEEPTLTIAGGASTLLRFHIPGQRVRSIAPNTLTLTVDLDVADFTPRKASDGSIDLYLS